MAEHELGPRYQRHWVRQVLRCAGQTRPSDGEDLPGHHGVERYVQLRQVHQQRTFLGPLTPPVASLLTSGDVSVLWLAGLSSCLDSRYS